MRGQMGGTEPPIPAPTWTADAMVGANDVFEWLDPVAEVPSVEFRALIGGLFRDTDAAVRTMTSEVSNWEAEAEQVSRSRQMTCEARWEEERCASCDIRAILCTHLVAINAVERTETELASQIAEDGDADWEAEAVRATMEAEFGRYKRGMSPETVAVLDQIMAKFDAMDAKHAAWVDRREKEYAAEEARRAKERAAEDTRRAKERAPVSANALSVALDTIDNTISRLEAAVKTFRAGTDNWAFVAGTWVTLSGILTREATRSAAGA